MSQIARIERDIAALESQIRALDSKPFGESITVQQDSLRSRRRELTTRLHDLRPYTVHPDGGQFIVAYRGNFVSWGGTWLRFPTEAAAHDWIACRTSLEAAE